MGSKVNTPYELLLDNAPVIVQPELLRRKTSASGTLTLTDVIPTLTRRASGPARTSASTQLVVAVQPRQKDKFVPLPKALETSDDTDNESVVADPEEPARIAVYCVAERFDRKLLEPLLLKLYRAEDITIYDDVIQLTSGLRRLTQDVFLFDFGVIITFGLSDEEDRHILQDIVSPVEINTHLARHTEVDNFKLAVSTEVPHIKNDCFTVNKRQAQTRTVRLAIAHALAQSSKLSVYEAQVWGLVEATKPLPESLAKTGRVPVSTKQVAKLIGQVFLQNANVNLLSSVLDTPEFFWSAPDSLQALYDRACEYLELQTRIDVLNARFQVLQEMLDMLRSHQNNVHASRLEYIVIWLLVVDCVLMGFQLLSLFGLIGQESV